MADPETSVVAPERPIARLVGDAVDPEDAKDNKWIAVTAYLGPALLVAVILGRTSPYARYHLNQGLVFTITWIALFIASAVASALLAFIPIVGWLAAGLIEIAIVVGWFAMAYHGVRNALEGRAQPLPMIGKALTVLK